MLFGRQLVIGDQLKHKESGQIVTLMRIGITYIVQESEGKFSVLASAQMDDYELLNP